MVEVEIIGMDSQRINQPVSILKKNCVNCRCLDYYEKDGWEDSSSEGFYCTGRAYKTEKEEDNHLIKLEDQSYRLTSKKCHKIKKV